MMGSEAVTEWVAALQYHPNLHNRFSFDSCYRFIFHRYRNSVYGLRAESFPFDSDPCRVQKHSPTGCG